MRRTIRIGAIVTGLAFALVGAAAMLLYRGSQQVPEFYREAISTPPEVQAVASQQLIEQAANLVSHSQQPGHWEALFTVEQINGWLAVDLVKNHRHALPREVSEPRISLAADRASLACRWTTNQLSTVFSLDADLYLAEPNVVALRVRGAHAGSLPLPLSDILDGITRAAEELNLQIRWLLAERDPVALITIAPPDHDEKTAVQIEALELREGAIYLAGQTIPKEAANNTGTKADAANSQPVEAAADAGQVVPQVKVQR